MAIAAGKSIPFPQPAWGGHDMGTDGGMHNFLRYLENRGVNSSTVNYAGSMISMYYSQYDTACSSAVILCTAHQFVTISLILSSWIRTTCLLEPHRSRTSSA